MPDKQPNILVIWGDDIGITNLSCYSDGLMGYRTPNIDRIADEGMRFTDSYGEQSCTAGRSSFITGQSVYRTGLSKVGMPGADVGLQAEDVDDRGAAQAARLRDRAVRQEPPRRPEQVPADRPRLRRVLRQPLPPQRRGGARGGRTGRRRRTSRASTSASGRAASCTRWATDADDDDRGRALRARRAPADRGHRAADQEADGDDRRRGARPRARLHRPPGRRGHAVLLLVQHDAHALPHAPEAGERRAGRALAVALPRHDDRPRQGRRRAAGQARRARAGRGHDRHLQHRQRPAHEHVARRRHDAVPQREEHQLGGRLPGPGDDPLARQDRRRASSRTRSSSTTTGCRRSSPPPASPTSSTSSRPATRSATPPSRSTSTATTCCRT